MIYDVLDIHEGEPKQPGLYVAYVNDNFSPRHAGRELLMWIDGRWGYRRSDQNYRGRVYGWIGPLPVLPLEDEPQEGAKW